MTTTNDTIFPYKITNDVILHEYDNDRTQAAINRIQPLVNAHQINAKVITKIKQAIQQYPKHPAFKNYLQNAYMLQDKPEKAIEYSKTTIKAHPDYLFAKLTLGIIYLGYQENIEAAEALIPTPGELHDLAPNQELFHISEVLSFEQYAILYYDHKGNIEELERREARLKELVKVFKSHIGAIQGLLQDCSRYIIMLRATIMQEAIENTKQVEATLKRFHPLSDEEPVFNHEAIHQLYLIESEEVSQNFIDMILELPRETLIQDLNTVLIDVQRRYDLYQSEENYHSAHNHAIYFLATLKATDSLQEVLNLLRQDEDFSDFYFGDDLEFFIPWPLYHLAQDQLEQLKAYMKEENNFTWFRHAVCEIPAQVGLLQPERREEAIAWYQDLLQYHIDHQDNVALNDGAVIAELILRGLHLEAKELIPLTKTAYEQGLVPEYIIGNLQKVLAEFENPAVSKILMAELDMAAMYVKYREGTHIHTTIKKAGYEAHFGKDKIIDHDDPMLSQMQSLLGLDEDTGNFEYEDEDNYIVSPAKPQALPNRDKKYGRNDKVNVQYTDGKKLENVKFKKIEDDWKKGLCEIVS